MQKIDVHRIMISSHKSIEKVPKTPLILHWKPSGRTLLPASRARSRNTLRPGQLKGIEGIEEEERMDQRWCSNTEGDKVMKI